MLANLRDNFVDVPEFHLRILHGHMAPQVYVPSGHSIASMPPQWHQLFQHLPLPKIVATSEQMISCVLAACLAMGSQAISALGSSHPFVTLIAGIFLQIIQLINELFNIT